MYVYGSKIPYTCRVGYRYLFGKTIAGHRFSSALNVSTKSAICGLSNTSETEGVWLNVPKPCQCKYRLGAQELAPAQKMGLQFFPFLLVLRSFLARIIEQ